VPPTTTTTSTPAPGASAPASATASLSSGNSDQSLNQDMGSIDTQMSGFNTDASAAAQTQ
jgi:hypothetical protein